MNKIKNACLGLMAWGIVDSLIHYQPRKKIDADDSLLPHPVGERRARLVPWLGTTTATVTSSLSLGLGWRGEF